MIYTLLIVVAGFITLIGIVLFSSKNNRKSGKTIFSFGLLLLIFSLAVNFTSGNSTKESNDKEERISKKTVTTVKDGKVTERSTITAQQYNKINIGDSKKKVNEVLGKVTEDSKTQNSIEDIWIYSGKDQGLAYISFSRETNKVVQKQETGLLEENSNTITTQEGTVNKDDWSKQIENISKQKASKSDKYERLKGVIENYSGQEQEVKEFEDYIVKQYASGKYIKDIKDDQYMLTNIFKSSIVNTYYKDTSREPMASFSSSFLLNSKDVYLEINKPDSTSVKAEENKMEKQLKNIRK